MGALRTVSQGHGYGIVLGLVVVSFVLQVASPDTDVIRVIVAWLSAVTLVVAVRVAHASLGIVRLGALVATLLAAAATLMLVVDEDIGEGLTSIVSGLLVGFAPMVIAGGLLRDLRTSHTVTLRTLAGVLAIYVLAGMFFSFVYATVDHLVDRPFFAQITSPNSSDFLYFSYVTLTTTGFGDLTAAQDLGRTFVVIEALFGQIYLVTIVALIVSNLGRAPATPRQ